MQVHDFVTTVIPFAVFTTLIFFFVVALVIRYRKRRQETEELKARFVEERLKIQVEIQEETLKHVSRELHDNLGHVASLIKINLNTLNAADDNIEDKIEDTKNLTRQLIGDLKQLSVRLSDNQVVENGLLYAIETEMDRLNKTGVFKGQLNLEGETDVTDKIENDKAIILYRMVQEVVNNFIKHSVGTELNTSILCIGKNITLELRDNGAGFDTGQQFKEGSGLKNLRYRAHLINASLDISSIIGTGTTITIKFPV